MNDFSNMTIIKRKRYLGLLYFAGSIIILICGCFVMFEGLCENLIDKMICLLGIVFFSFCTIKTFSWAVLSPVLFAYNDEGFYLKTFDKFIKWSEVSEINTHQITICDRYTWYIPQKSSPILFINLHNEQEFLNRLSTKAKLLYEFNKNSWGYGICVALPASGTKFEELLELFLSKCTNLTTPFVKD